jgi:hypothetical protein
MSKLLEFKASFDEIDTVKLALADDGAIVLRGLAPIVQVSAIREAFESTLEHHGWAERRGETLEPTEAAWRHWGKLADPAQAQIVRDAHVVPGLYALPHEPMVRRFFDKLFDGESFCHPLPAVRIMAPCPDSYEGIVTEAHQDWTQLLGSRAGVTAWMPLHAVGEREGALQVALGTHTRGRLPPFGDEIQNFEWTSASFEPGDILLFNTLTVHRGPRNRSGRFRLSIDFRMQPIREPINTVALPTVAGTLPHGLTWDEIYSHCPGFEHKFYWQTRCPEIAYESNEEYFIELAEERALRRLRNGDRSAIDEVGEISRSSIFIKRRLAARKLLAAIDLQGEERRV